MTSKSPEVDMICDVVVEEYSEDSIALDIYVKALVLLQLLIPFLICSFVNVTADIIYFCLISLDTSRVSREEVCLPRFDVVNCLLK